MVGTPGKAVGFVRRIAARNSHQQLLLNTCHGDFLYLDGPVAGGHLGFMPFLFVERRDHPVGGFALEAGAFLPGHDPPGPGVPVHAGATDGEDEEQE